MARMGLSRDLVKFQRMVSITNVYRNTTGSCFNHTWRYAHLVYRLDQEDIEQVALQDLAVATMCVRLDTVTKAITTVDRIYTRGIYWAITSIM